MPHPSLSVKRVDHVAEVWISQCESSKLSIMAIKLDDEAKKHALDALKTYVGKHSEWDMGDLAAELMLEFVLTEIGPIVYNQAISDAQTFMGDRVLDLEALLQWPDRGRQSIE